jgi:glutamate-1-semialdehyde 2,1-aminomutase
MESLRLAALGLYGLTGYGFGRLHHRDAAARQAALGRLIRRLLIAAGPLYIKIGQIISTRFDLLPGAVLDQLVELQDNVPPMSDARLRRLLARELGDPDALFERFDYTPLASASIAQVHRARLRGGDEVAVKIVRDRVAERLRQSSRFLRALVWLLERCIPRLRLANLRKRYAEIDRLLLGQVDLALESANQMRIRENFQGHPYVRVPAVHEKYCTRRILVMEYVEAIPGKEVRKVRLPARQLAARLQDAIYTMLYLDGLAHGDPHPGNVFFTADGDIILLDFGICVYLSESEKWSLSSFFYACSRNEWDLAIERFIRVFVEDPAAVEGNDAFRRDIERVIRHHFEERAGRWSTGKYLRDISVTLMRHGAKYTANMTKVQLVFASGEGFLNIIDPAIDIWENARKFNDRYSPYMSDRVKAKFDAYFAARTPASLRLKREADPVLVAPTHLHRYFFPSEYPLFVKRAAGSRIVDLDDNEYIDLSSGYGPHILGYADPELTESLRAAAQNGTFNAIGNAEEVRLAGMIVEALPGADKVILCNSGTEAGVQAIRIARAHTGRNMVAKCEGQYHGYSDYGLVSSWFRFDGPLADPRPIVNSRGQGREALENTLVLQYGDVPGLARLDPFRDRLACVICEPMPTGLCRCDEPFLRALRAKCTALDIPLVFDEVVSGFRVCYGGVQSRVGIAPDLTLLGKIIGGGLPCGAVAGTAALIDTARTTGDPFTDYDRKAFVGGTMSGSYLVCAAGSRMLSILKARPERYARLEALTAKLCERFRAAAAALAIPFQISSYASIVALSFKHRPTIYYREKFSGSNFKANLALSYYMRRHGVYLPELHTLLLNMAHTEEDVALVARAFEASLGEMLAEGFFQT